MKPKNTLILLVIGLALGLFLYFDRNHPSAEEQRENTGRVVKVDRDQVDAVTIKNGDAKVELRKRGEPKVWYVEAPLKDRADSETMAEIFTTLETMRSAAAIPLEKNGKELLKEYGISDSTVRATLEGEKKVELVVGKDSAVEGKSYLYVEGGDQVYVVENALKNQLTKKPEDFRDRSVTELTAGQITQVTVKSASGELELTRDGAHWNITKPLKARGDDAKINDLVAQATTARVAKFIGDTNLATYGLTEPRGSITMKVEGQEKPLVLQIGNNPTADPDKEKTHLKASTREGVLLVPKAIEAALTKTPNDLRDRVLVRVESDIVDRITVKHEGAETFTVARKGETWVRKDGTNDVAINSAVVTRMLSDLQSVTVSDFVADNDMELAKYGLDKPQTTVTFSSYASGNTAETTAGEKPIVTVLFGKTDGEQVYAKLDNEPFVVAVTSATLLSIPPGTIQLQPLGIYSYKPAEITALEMTPEGQPAATLVRDGETKWKLAKGDGNINQANVNKLVETLAGMSAASWAGPKREEYGLEKPRVLITFTAKQGEKTVNEKLALGAATAEGTVYAEAEGKNGVFTIAQPDFTALQAQLTDKQAPPAPATAVPAPQPMPEQNGQATLPETIRKLVPGATGGMYPDAPERVRPATPLPAPAPVPGPMPATPPAVPAPSAAPAAPAAAAPAPPTPPATTPAPPATPVQAPGAAVPSLAPEATLPSTPPKAGVAQ